MTTMHQTLHIPKYIPSERLWKDLFKIIAVSLFFAGIAILIRNETVRAHIMNIPSLTESLMGVDLSGKMGLRAALFVVAFSLLIGVGVPRLWVSAIAGALSVLIPPSPVHSATFRIGCRQRTPGRQRWQFGAKWGPGFRQLQIRRGRLSA